MLGHGSAGELDDCPRVLTEHVFETFASAYREAQASADASRVRRFTRFRLPDALEVRRRMGGDGETSAVAVPVVAAARRLRLRAEVPTDRPGALAGLEPGSRLRRMPLAMHELPGSFPSAPTAPQQVPDVAVDRHLRVAVPEDCADQTLHGGGPYRVEGSEPSPLPEVRQRAPARRVADRPSSADPAIATRHRTVRMSHDARRPGWRKVPRTRRAPGPTVACERPEPRRRRTKASPGHPAFPARAYRLVTGAVEARN